MTAVGDWSKPAALAIPKEGYFELEHGRYGPVFPHTPACYGFSLIAKVKEGRSIFGLYPPSPETRAEFEAWKKTQKR